jgi:hypothetical protein
LAIKHEDTTGCEAVQAEFERVPPTAVEDDIRSSSGGATSIAVSTSAELSMAITWCAPRAAAACALSWLETIATTSAPAYVASWTTAPPAPPAAARTTIS